jgi:hypothetical protein
LQKQKRGTELHVYLEEGTYHKRLFRGPNTNDMKKEKRHFGNYHEDDDVVYWYLNQ